MRLDTMTAAIGLALVAADVARGQFPPRTQSAPPPTTARVETAPLVLSPPDRYQIAAPLEPIRRVALMVPADGIVRSVAVPVGATVREMQEVVQLDRAEAVARLKIAQAGVKEMQAALEGVRAQATATGTSKPTAEIAEARLEAARAQAELAQLDLDRCTLRAPFAGRLLAAPVASGQYVTKGTTVAELADVSSLRVLVPVDRTATAGDAPLDLSVEGKLVTGKVRALLPLPEAFAPLRDLAAPLAAAWVEIANTDGALEPGQRARSPHLPIAPIAVVPSRAVREADGGAGGPSVQVIRNELVTDVPVLALGEVGPERTQVAGPFRPNDVLIVESSPLLAAGTLIRFDSDPNRPVETTGPRPGEVGAVVNITPPSGVAPIGPPGSAAPEAAPRPGRTPARPATPAPATPKPAQPPARQPVPF